MMKRWAINAIILAVIASFFLWSNLSESSALKRIEGVFFDLRYQLSLTEGETKHNASEVIIVDIDDHSLNTVGRWPWSRETFAQLLAGIQAQSAMITAVDVVLSEPEENIVDRIAEKSQAGLSDSLTQALKEQRDVFDFDQQLAQQVGSQDTVLGYFFHQDGIRNYPIPPTPIRDDVTNTDIITYRNHTVPMPQLSDNALGHGFLTIVPDVDGVYRRAPLIIQQDGKFYPSLALETIRQYVLADSIDPQFDAHQDQNILQGVSIGGVDITTDRHGQIIIPFKGKRKSFTYISAADMLTGKSHPEMENAIVLIGTSALGLADLRTVSVDTLLPGVEVHANIIHAIINDLPLYTQPDWAMSVSMLVTLLFAVWVLWLFPKLNAQQMFAVTFITVGALLVSNFSAWKFAHLDLPIALPLFIISGLILKEFLTSYLKEQKQRELIKSHFDKYVPPAHIDRMMNQPESFTLEGEKKEMTVLFADIRNFTTISESLEVEDLKRLLNAYFTPITNIIFEHQGTVDKFIGDMVMAFWNAPLNDPKHAHHAIVAAKAMLACTQALNEQFKDDKLPDVHIGIGINTGMMNVGDMGSEMRRNYTVLGNAVNAGARIESLTKAYKTPLLVGPLTHDACPEWVFRHIDYVTMRGQHHPIHLYEPVALRSEISSELLALCDAHNAAMARYFDGDLRGCRAAMIDIAQRLPDVPFYPHFIEKLDKRIDSIRAKLGG